LPAADAIDTKGTDVTSSDMKELLTVDVEGWKKEVESVEESYRTYGTKLPHALKAELDALKARLNK
jgi:phosphoenolpyruvate carboxykinase (GTP)